MTNSATPDTMGKTVSPNRGGDHRTRLRELKYTKLDLYGALAVAAYIAVIVLEGRLLG